MVLLPVGVAWHMMKCVGPNNYDSDSQLNIFICSLRQTYIYYYLGLQEPIISCKSSYKWVLNTLCSVTYGEMRGRHLTIMTPPHNLIFLYVRCPKHVPIIIGDFKNLSWAANQAMNEVWTLCVAWDMMKRVTYIDISVHDPMHNLNMVPSLIK